MPRQTTPLVRPADRKLPLYSCRAANTLTELGRSLSVLHGHHGASSTITPFASVASSTTRRSTPVAGLRLGCLNHALLTAEAIRARGLTLAGWVANRIDPQMQAQEDNIAYLREQLKAPLWADVPRMAQPRPASIQWLAATPGALHP